MPTQTAVAKAVSFCLFALSTATVSGAVVAQEAGVNNDVERIEVTGSRIKRTDMENASPVVVIGSEDIEKGGFNSVQDVLGNLSQNSGGSMTQQEVHGFTPAASSVNLRGVGAGRVLTLINGKRVPKYPFGAGGSDSFVDTANIPMGAIERIEILTTGASAIYGSDAMGGVINIILKKDINETTFKYRVSDTHEGGMQTNQFSLMTGVSNETSNLTFFLEYDDREALKGTDRPEWGTDIIPGNYFAGYSSYGAGLFNSATGDQVVGLSAQECEARGMVALADGRCGYDRSKQRDFMPEQTRYSTMVNLTKELNDDHTWYSRMDYTHSETYTEIESSAIGDDMSFNVAGDQVTINSARFGLSKTYDKATGFGGDFAGLSDGTYHYQRRLTELGPRTSAFTTNNFSFITGLEGYLTDNIEYDTSWSIARQKVDGLSGGSPTYQGLFDYLTSGENGQSFLDVVNPNSAELLNYEESSEGQSTLSVFNFGINGDAWELPGGSIGYAAGVEYSKEWFYDKSDSISKQGGIIGKGGTSAQGDRDQYAVYAEVALPLIDQLTATLAGRYDYYDDASDVGGQFSPQVAIEYRPIDSLLIRALYAETFRAPDMQKLFGEPINGFTTVVDTPRCEAYGDCEKKESIDSVRGPNQNLEAETGKNYNLGVVWGYEGFDISVDYWVVEIDNIVSAPSSQYILDNADEFADNIIRDENGQLKLINSQFMNMSSRDTSGIDFALAYTFETAELGDFTTRLEGTYLTKWETKISESSAPEDGLDSDGSVPKLRANWNIGWQKDDFQTNFLVKYTDTMHGYYESLFIDLGLDEFYDVTVDSHVELNWMASYYITDAFKLTGGVNNVFDAQPELDGTDPNWPHFPRGFYNAVGREYYLTFEVTF